MSFQKPRKGNPLQLTVDQHFHTAHAIDQFSDDDGYVEVFDLNSGAVLKRRKRAKVFCAKRNWDERAERGYMVSIESQFHDQIDNHRSFADRDHRAISRYLALWRLRHRFHLERASAAPLNGVTGECLSQEEQEILEKKHVGYVNELGQIPSRQLAGAQIQIGIDQIMVGLGGVRWGLLYAGNGDFLSADCYHEFCFIPISPKYAYAGGFEDRSLAYDQVAEINKKSIASAQEFYFGNTLSACPVA
ncbi:hypothetical protein [Vreelandella neptunia]|uniref:Uncharacterized protein n=1 Tax=Vreelandella neptunia TaxID=115551 RepID=A0ABS9SC19_9GAMM|nr:hypothetical protein [Halomonas neptunia]MCH4813661.1 hypothetical protein [Halomonas neptunia]